MKTNDAWVIFETEVSGMKRPLYAVEIAAQRMLGYAPDGTTLKGMRVARASSGPKIPRRKRHRIYDSEY